MTADGVHSYRSVDRYIFCGRLVFGGEEVVPPNTNYVFSSPLFLLFDSSPSEEKKKKKKQEPGCHSFSCDLIGSLLCNSSSWKWKWKKMWMESTSSFSLYHGNPKRHMFSLLYTMETESVFDRALNDETKMRQMKKVSSDDEQWVLDGVWQFVMASSKKCPLIISCFENFKKHKRINQNKFLYKLTTMFW